MLLVNSHGLDINLGRKLGSGGEGYVAELPQFPKFVAKIYHSGLSSDKQRKLLCMSPKHDEALAKVSAWPTDVLYDKKSKAVRGFLMENLVSYTPIHSIYSPVERKQKYPNHDWVFLVNVARNVASAFAVMHQHGIIIGDVNQNSVYVANNSAVKFIDCDSFQIEVANKLYPCVVGQREFTPPELQKVTSLDGVRRTQNHDNFCLAILIFQLLLMGRHPFAGVYSGLVDMPIEKAIDQSLYAYSVNAGKRLMSPPPNSMLPSILSTSLIENFERAFSPSSIHGGRPDAINWVRALEAFKQKIRTCGRDPIHKYFSNVATCPWCKAEQESAQIFFISKIAVASLKNFDLNGVWARIESVPAPEPMPNISYEQSQVQPRTLPTHLKGAKFFLLVQKIAVVAVAIGIISAYPASWIIAIPVAWFLFASIKNNALNEEIQTRRANLAKAQTSMNEFDRNWENVASDKLFKAKKQALLECRIQHGNIQADFGKEKEKLQLAIRQNQLKRFLSNYHISRSTIDGIGPARKATLRSFGIETAADIQYRRVMNISGFGPHLAGKLESWRRSLEVRFVFDPAKGIDSADMTALQQKFALRKKELEGKLLAGQEELLVIKQTILRNRQQFLPQMKQLALNLAQARSDLALVS